MKIPVARAAMAALLVLAACGPNRPSRHARPASERPFLNAAFTPGYSVEAEGRRVAFEPRQVGTLRITSGRLVACDAFICGGEPFTKRVPEGAFPLHLAIAHVEPGHERVALAKIAFSREPVVSWEPALIDGQDLAGLKEDERFGYPVDSGTGAFMDADAWRWYRSYLGDSLIAKMNGAPFLLVSAGGSTAALIHSGWGDGHYPTYWGYDARGNLVAAVTDFLLFP
jgi:hypothetical protein